MPLGIKDKGAEYIIITKDRFRVGGRVMPP
jgi:hypothetical protein